MHLTLKSAFFQDFTQGRTVVSYRRFGTTYPSHFQASKQLVYVVMRINLLKMAADCGLWTEFFSSLLQWIYSLKRTGGRLLRNCWRLYPEQHCVTSQTTAILKTMRISTAFTPPTQYYFHVPSFQFSFIDSALRHTLDQRM
jgi:hypothetical protein